MGHAWHLCEGLPPGVLRPNSDQLLKWEVDGLTDRLLLPHSKVWVGTRPHPLSSQSLSLPPCVCQCDVAPTPVALGNVHTGAVPPWLREEGEASGRAEIGPSEEEFRLHRGLGGAGCVFHLIGLGCAHGCSGHFSAD